jgi:stage II sporulation SpoE-like protein
LDAHLRAGERGLIDLLAVDGSRALTILEIERDGEEDLLSRSLDHQEWVESEIHFLRRLYGPERIHPFRTPRAILLAQNYSDSFLRKVSDLQVPITPILYRLGEEGSSRPLLIESVSAMPPPLRIAPRAAHRISRMAATLRRLSPEELAEGVQRSLLPAACPPMRGYDIAGTTLSCHALGGDTYDFLRRAGNRLWIMVGDVAGKGHAAALILSHFHAMIRGLAATDRPLFQLVGKLNDILSRALPINEFISFFVLELEPENGIIRYVNAGHNPPALIRISGRTEFLNGSGPVLGVVPGCVYPAHEIRMEPGDTLLLYTDGATESQNQEMEEFGEERLVQCLRDVSAMRSEAGLARLQRFILDFCGPVPRFDDITLVLLRRVPDRLPAV